MIDKIDIKIKKLLLELLKYEIKLEKNLNFSDEELEELIQVAKKQHIFEYLYFNLKKNNLLDLFSQAQQKYMKNSFERATFRNLSLLGEIKKIKNELEKNSIEMIILKGPHLMEDIYPHIALRFARDIDILVSKDKGEESYKILKELNYDCEKELKEIDFEFIHGKHLDQMIRDDKKYIIEIHADIDNNIKVNINNFFNNSSNGKLSLEDLIIHLSIHLSYCDLFKMDLRHYLDFYMILKEKSNEIKWDKLITDATKYNCLEGIYIVFKILEKLFDIKTPTKIDSLYNYSIKYNNIISNAIDFLWLYDKRSSEYIFYKNKTFLYTTNENFLKKSIKKLFLSKNEMAFTYSINQNSIFLNFYYLRRLYNLIKNHSLNIIKLKTDNSKKEFIDKSTFIYNYLHGEK